MSVSPKSKPKRIAVLIFNLGGPAKPGDVRDFLYNLFSDPYIIGLPWGLRQGVAALIANGRAKSARANYARMGGGSPILAETEAQGRALEKALKKQLRGQEVRVFVGMRYWHPFIAETVAEVEAWTPDEIVVLPLYPQFSSTTTLTGFDAFKKAYSGPAKVRYVCCYAGNDDFVAVQAGIVAEWMKLAGDNVRILFSAHGLPEKIIRQGDPYQEQVERCVARIMAELGDIDHVVCYQSRVGPLAWIGPSTEDAIREAGASGKDVVVVPIAFVSEHIETRVELDMDYGALAAACGVRTYVRAPTVKTAPRFIAALAGEVIKALASDGITGDNDCAACHVYCPKRRAA